MYEGCLGEDPGVVITLTSPTAPGVVETYTTFKDIADGVVNARVWVAFSGGRQSVQGRVVGEELGRYVVGHFPGRDGR